ncbi:MAG: NnrU family protein [Alphaproteobacteria bacterium]|nr:NnrU family protein [Alphaproteobacteria bacterium]
MTVLVLGLIIFLGIHYIPLFPGVKRAIVGRLGEGLYRPAFAITAVIGFVLIIYGKIIAHPPVILWTPPEWSRHLAFSLVPIAIILLVSSYAPGHIRRWVRHPMLAGTALWSFAHLMANGELSAAVLFGAFLFWSTTTFVLALFRETPPPVVKGWGGDITAVIIGVILTTLLMNFHMHLFGVAIIG